MFSEQDKKNGKEISKERVDEIFDDFKSRSNLVGLYDLLLKIDHRINPHLYALKRQESDD